MRASHKICIQSNIARRICFLVAIVLASLGLSRAQAPVQFPDTAPERGVSPVGSYVFEKFETISKTSRALVYSIPLTTMPLGRGGMTFPVTLNYNSGQYDYAYNYSYSTATSPPQTPILNQTLQADPYGGWSLGAGYQMVVESKPLTSSQSCTTGTGVVRSSLQMPDGSRHALQFYGFPQGYTGEGDGFYPWDYTGTTACTNYSSLSSVYMYTSDGTYIRVRVNPNAIQNWVAYMPDGSTVTNQPNNTAQIISDRNGNKITIQYPSTAGGNTVLSDDEGRTITVQPTSGGWTVSQAGFGGAPLVWSFGPALGSNPSAFTFSYTCIPSQAQYCQTTGSGGGTDMLQVPSSTPGTPLVYTFHYYQNSGLLQTVTLPTGASTTYTWDCSDYTQCFDSFLRDGVTGKQVIWTDTSDGGSTQRVENWSYSGGVGAPGLFVRTAPDGGQEKTYLGADVRQGYPTVRIVEPDGSSTDYFYQNNVPFGEGFNPYVAAKVVSVASQGSPTKSSTILYSLDKNGNQLAAATYDWTSYSGVSRDQNGVLTALPSAPSSALLQQTSTTYTVATSAQTGSGTEQVADDSNAFWNPNAPLLLHAVSTQTISGSATNSSFTTYSYDAKGNPAQQARWDSTKVSSPPSTLDRSSAAVTNWVWNSYGDLTQITDPNGISTNYSYDHNSVFLTQKVQAAGTSVARTFNYGWDSYTGLLTSKTDADNSITTTYSYDAEGRQINVTQAAGILPRQKNTVYDDFNRNVTVRQDQNTNGDGVLTAIMHYDQLDRVDLLRTLETSTQQPTDATAGVKTQTRYLYSGSNLYILTSNPYRASSSGAASSESTMGWTVKELDQNGRTISVQSFAGSGLPAPWGSNTASTGTVTTVYQSEVTTLTDQAGNSRANTADALGHLVSVVEDPGGANLFTQYTYDSLGNLAQTQQDSQARSFVYDSLGRLSKAANPESGFTSYTYDSDGNLLQRSDARQSLTQYSYDALNRITKKAYSNNIASIAYTPSVSYTYSQAGQYSVGLLTGVEAMGVSSTTFSGFDALRRFSQSTQTTAGNAYTFAYNYNLADLIISETLPSGRKISVSSYDAVNRPLGVNGLANGQSATYAVNVTYTADSKLQSYAFGNGLGRSTTYNSRLQPIEMADQFSGQSTAVLDLQFGWVPSGQPQAGNNGNLASEIIQANGVSPISQTFSYDRLNRLLSFMDNGGGGNNERDFAYDRFGNSWVSNDTGFNLSGATPSGSANPFDPTSNRLITGSYDASGNQVLALGSTLTYDAENRIAQLIEPNWTGSGQESFLYDGDGKRIEKIVSGGSAIVYVYDGRNHLMAEYSSSNPGASCQTCYLSVDHLGSTRLTTDAFSNIVSFHDYLPFGEEITGGSAGRPASWGSQDGVNQKFTGKERDQESGLDYFGARYYGSALGRFTSPDPIGIMKQKLLDPQQWNAYGYARNNPLRFMDPTGKYVISCGSGVKDCNKQTEAFNNAVMNGLHSKDQSVVSAAKAYGTLGEKNGVNVSIVTVVDPNNKGVTGSVGAMAGTGGTQSTADGRFMQATQVKIQAGLSADQLSDTTVHEGQHVGDRENFVNALQADQSGALVQGLNITHKMSEVNAYGVENANRGERGQDPRDINDILSHRPYSTDPNINRPLFPDFPSPYAPN